jgi:hypothetical protein
MTEIKDAGNRELDLLEIIVSIFKTLGKWIVYFFKGLISAIIFMLKKWIPLSIGVIIGLVLAYVIYKTSEPVYSTEMTVKSNTLSNADIISYINTLHDFCSKGNINALSSALDIKPEAVTAVKDIMAFWVIDRNKDGVPDYTDFKHRYNVYDTLNIRMQDRFVIRVRFSSPDELQPIRNGIFTYVEKNLYFKQQNDIRLQQLNDLIGRLSYDINQLDSLQKIKYYEETKKLTPQQNGQMVFLQEQKTQLVYEDIYKLYDRKQALTREKFINPAILSVISDFALPQRPYNGTVQYSFITVPILFFITLVILVLIAKKEAIKDLFRKY